MKSVEFIAEISSNHNNDLNRSIEMIEAAADAGCDGVKFQLFKLDRLFAREILENSQKHRTRKNWELPLEFLPKLSETAHKLNLSFSCTPFYLDAVDELLQYVDFYKVASYELLWFDLFSKILKTGKPLVFSTGMATVEEIDVLMDFIRKENRANVPVTMLHCTSAYPTPVEDANLSIIKTLQERYLQPSQNIFDITVGWSDHTVSPAVIYRAVHQYNVLLVEFHLDLDGKGEEFIAGHCWLPYQIKSVISNIRAGFIADGEHSIQPADSELADRDWRADPADGLRPMKHIRQTFRGDD